ESLCSLCSPWLAYEDVRMNVIEIDQMGALRECVQQLAVQVARLSQAVEPLVRVQEEQNRLRDRIAELEGFRTALLWLTGVLGATRWDWGMRRSWQRATCEDWRTP